jgi:hypothetical protein
MSRENYFCLPLKVNRERIFLLAVRPEYSHRLFNVWVLGSDSDIRPVGRSFFFLIAVK